jgi:hypothetical protein
VSSTPLTNAVSRCWLVNESVTASCLRSFVEKGDGVVWFCWVISSSAIEGLRSADLGHHSQISLTFRGIQVNVNMTVSLE